MATISYRGITGSVTNDTSTIIWNSWAGTSATSTSSTIWTSWIETTATTNTSGIPQWIQAPAESPEQRQSRADAEAARRVAQQAAWAEQMEKEKAANERAEKLLLSNLTGRQRRQYQKNKTFTVKGRDGNRYRINPKWAGHVERLNDRFKPVERFCIHPVDQVPVPDNQLVAKLMLETDPARFRQIANVTQLAA